MRGDSRWRAAACAAVVAALAAACGGGGGDSADGFVAADVLEQRRAELIDFVSARPQADRFLLLAAHIERERRDGWRSFLRPLPADVWDERIARMDRLADNRDFLAFEMLVVLARYGDHDLLPRALVEKAEAALWRFKYWYTDPTPPGRSDVSYYWSENHQITYHVLEYLAGQLYPQVRFADGRRGVELIERAAPLIERWIDLRVGYGFSEWHSNVYYQKDLNAMLALAELAADERLATRAAMVADLILLDFALHTREAKMGVTHGRSEKDDQTDGRREATWGAVKFVFDQTEHGYEFIHPDAILLAIAERYRIPEVIRRIGRSREAFVSRESIGIPLVEDSTGEQTPAPAGLSYTAAADLPVWWGMGAFVTAPIVPLSIETLNAYDLWESPFFAPFREVRPITEDPVAAQQLAAALAPMVNEGLLQRVNTYTYRTAEYMLSTAQDYRKGRRSAQSHAWHATLGVAANVFTNHPATPPLASTDWDADRRPGYWTGSASLPRSAQFENVAIHIYHPLYASSTPPPLDAFAWEPYTHAYFPQDAFDEVVRRGAWTYGRLGDAYVALFSQRPVEWVDYDPAVYATNGFSKPFDLRATGGADNVWIVECGSRSEWGDFDSFVAAVDAAGVLIEGEGADVVVQYDSPSKGAIRFGWEGPFSVDGEVVSLVHGRMENPFVRVFADGQGYEVDYEGWSLHLDFSTDARRAAAPAAPQSDPK